MSEYQIIVCDSAYSEVAYIARYRRLEYKQRLNAVGAATLELHPDDSKIALVDIKDSGGNERLRRLKVLRDGVLVFSGLIERCGWEIPETAPKGETWKAYALDLGCYLDWRLIVPAAGQAADKRSGAADDVIKAYVYNHAGAGAAAARQFSDLTVEANEALAPSYSAEERYTILLNAVNKICQRDRVWWYMDPGASGVTFRTSYPLYGLDRTKGNGVNSECVLEFSARNFHAAEWYEDRLEAANYTYVAGQGQEEDRTIVERSDATSIAALLRRETFIDARQLTLVASLQARGDAALKDMRPLEGMDAQPVFGTWKTTWNLGDKITIFLRPDYGGGWRDFRFDPVITGVDVTLTSEQLETAVPIMEKL